MKLSVPFLIVKYRPDPFNIAIKKKCRAVRSGAGIRANGTNVETAKVTSLTKMSVMDSSQAIANLTLPSLVEQDNKG